jgi:hypothetical protein
MKKSRRNIFSTLKLGWGMRVVTLEADKAISSLL